MLDGRSIYEVDMANMTDKPWRRPGSDISDWFNYGFDEISWEAYCYRRRELGEMATVMKANLIVSFFYRLDVYVSGDWWTYVTELFGYARRPTV